MASPLARKLLLKPGMRAAVIGAPDGHLEALQAGMSRLMSGRVSTAACPGRRRALTASSG